MKKSRRAVIPFWLILALVVQGCDDNEEPIPEKPATRTKVVGEDGTAGPIQLDNWHDVLTISGPGSFISAKVSKKGGAGNDPTGPIRTTVRLTMDRKEVILKSFEVARAIGIAGHNYSGVSWFAGRDDIETLVLGYGQPLTFLSNLILSIKVDDRDVDKVFVSATYMRVDTGEDEGGQGGDGEGEFP